MERETVSLLLALPEGELTPSLWADLAESALNVETASSLVRFDEKLAAGGVGVAAVDLTLLEQPWFEHLASWRLQGVFVPVIFILEPDFDLEASPDIALGRYDFIVKPLRASELLIRARSVATVEGRPSSDTLRHGDLSLHVTSKEVTLSGQRLELTALEYRMLRYLMMRENHIVSQSELSAHLYASTDQPDSNTIEAYISRLRRKIGPARIRTIRGLGYRFG